MAGADPVMLLLTVVLLGTTVLILLLSKVLWLHGKKKGDSKLPPGDMGWPINIVGSTFSLFKPHPATTLNDFLQLQLSRHGKIFSTMFLGRTLIVSADPEFNRFVLQNELKFFQSDLPPHFKTLMGEDNLSFLTGETFRRKKSMIHGFFNGFQLPTTFLAEVEEAAGRIMASWRHKTIWVVERPQSCSRQQLILNCSGNKLAAVKVEEENEKRQNDGLMDVMIPWRPD